MSASISVPQMTKVHSILVEMGVDGKILQHTLLEGGVLSDVADAAQLGTIPSRDELRSFLGLPSLGSKIKSILTFLREVKLGKVHPLATSQKYWEKARVVLMNEAFKEQFGDGLALPYTAESVYIVRKLECDSLDALIIAELGGEEKAESFVDHFNDFLMKNKKSSEWFIFYLRGKDGNLWAVSANWNVDFGGWSVDANSISFPFGWGADGRVVSRK